MGLHEKMTELADAVRGLTGGTDSLTLDEMIQSVLSVGTTDIVNTAAGNIIYITDCITRKLHSLTLYGKTVQSGVPISAAPSLPENAGNAGNISVNVDAQTLTISTPKGLPGIPVASGGNYTDANGQQWICDELDFARGKYVQRILQVVFDGSSDEAWAMAATNTTGLYRAATNVYLDTIVGAAQSHDISHGICSHYAAVPAGTSGTWGANPGFSLGSRGQLYIYDAAYSGSTSAAWKEWLANNPITCLFQLVTPVETDITAATLLAYSKLHTNYPQTVISNNAGAWMKVSYAADPKTYIDTKFTEVASAIVNNT